jgi:hypothetical protein
MPDHGRMRLRSGWAEGILASLCFGIAMGAFIKLEGASWAETLLGAFALGVFFGVTMGHYEARKRRRLAEAEGDLSRERVRLAIGLRIGVPCLLIRMFGPRPSESPRTT